MSKISPTYSVLYYLGSILLVGCFTLTCFLSCAQSQAIDLVEDLNFKRGISLRDPQEGTDKRCDTLFVENRSDKKPLWIMSQWASCYNLNSARLQTGVDGKQFYENEGKCFALYPDGKFRMEIRAKAEYGDQIRNYYESWPHLYIEQPLTNNIPISQYKELKYTLSAQLIYCKNYMGEAFNPQIHTCHVVSHIAVQNRNPESKAYLKSLFFSIPIFDYRYNYPMGENFVDSGTKEVVTNLFVYGPSGDKIWDGPLSSGKWQHADADLLPYIKEAISLAKWEDTTLNDLQVTHFIMGWESEGTFDAALEFKDLHLQAIISQ